MRLQECVCVCVFVWTEHLIPRASVMRGRILMTSSGGVRDSCQRKHPNNWTANWQLDDVIVCTLCVCVCVREREPRAWWIHVHVVCSVQVYDQVRKLINFCKVPAV